MKDTHRLAHFVKVYDDVIPQTACSDILSYFHFHNDKAIASGVENGQSDIAIRRAAEMNISIKGGPQAVQIHDFLVSASKTVMEWYYEDVAEYAEWLNPITSMESFRIKHYDMNEGYYKTHVDNVGERMFAVIFYLNDVTKGGETEFPLMKMKVPPKAGRVLVFPTTFMYPHQALVPVSNDKIMIQGYINR